MISKDGLDGAGGPPDDYYSPFEDVCRGLRLALFILDENHTCIFANQAAEALTGYTVGEMRGRLVHQLIHHTRPDGRPNPVEECPINCARISHEEQTGEDVFVRKDGTFFPAAYTTRPIIRNGVSIGAAFEVRDITLEKAALEAREADRRALAEQLAFRQAIDHALGAGVVALDMQGRLMYVNPAFSRMVGWSAEELIGLQPPFPHWPEEEHANIFNRYRELLGADSSFKLQTPIRNVELIFKRRNGERFNALMSVSKLGGKSEAQIGFLASVMDITPLKQSEAKLRELNATLEERVRERTEAIELRSSQLRRLAMQITRAEQRERERFADLLHNELQQMLTSALLFLQMAKRKLPEEHHNLLQPAKETLREVIGQTRTLTFEISPPILRHGDLAGALQWLAEWMSKRHGLKVGVKTDPGVSIPSEELKRCLFEATRELLFNVHKHAGCELAEIELRRTGDGLTLTIRDFGKGCDPEQLRKFQSGADSFGLFSLTERIHFFGGTVDFKTQPGRGFRTEIVVPLPAEARPERAKRSRPRRGRISGPCETPLSGESRIVRLLVVDDHKLVRQGMISLLREETNFQVVGEASDGVEAVSKAVALNPDVILMDINMPRMNGIEATRTLTREAPNCAVIGLSVNDDESTIESMLVAGARAYVKKDAPATELIAAVHSLFVPLRDAVTNA